MLERCPQRGLDEEVRRSRDCSIDFADVFDFLHVPRILGSEAASQKRVRGDRKFGEGIFPCKYDGENGVKKVCIFHFPHMENFHGYLIESLNPSPYFRESNSRRGAGKLFRVLTTAESIDRMYRERYPPYMHFVRDFTDKFIDADLLVLSMYNPIHPEVLYNELARPIKVLGFIDEPSSTYVRGVPYLWAFDGAFYISPSFNDRILFKDALKRWGCEQTYWLPQVPPQARLSTQNGFFWPLVEPLAQAARQGDRFFRERDLDLIYVGN